MEVGRAEIINMAMLYCGQDSILNPSGESKSAKLFSQFYDTTLQEVLSSHPWHFAMVAAQLQQINKTPRDVRFRNTFQLPINFGQMRSVLSQDMYMPRYDNAIAEEFRLVMGDGANSIPIPEYTIQGQELYTNLEQIQISYSRTDILPAEMTPLFRNLFAAILGLKLYTKVTGGLDGYEALSKQINLLRLETKRVDSEQADTLTPNRPNLLIRSRMY